MGRFMFDERFIRAPKLNLLLLWPAAYSDTASQAIETANKDFELVGTNADSTKSVIGNTGLELATAGAAADQMIVKPHADANQSAIDTYDWEPDRAIAASWAFLTDAAFVGQLICMGFRPTATLSAGATALDTVTDLNKFLVRGLEGTDTNFQLITSVGGVETVVDSGVPLAASTNYSFTVSVQADRSVVFTSQNLTTGALTTVPCPTVMGTASLGVPFFGVEATGAVAETIFLSRMRGSGIQQA
jgi:hypothetical protein